MSRRLSRLTWSRLEHPLVLVTYTLIALLASYPLATQWGDHIAGVDGDVWSYLWAMGWARVSLLNLGVNPFHTDYIFYPLGGATQLLWGTALPSFASIPLQLAFGLVPAFNLMYVAASVLTAYGMYLLARQVLGAGASTQGRVPSRGLALASFVASLVFSFGALRLGYGLAFTNLFHTEFVPFYLLLLVRATHTRTWHTAILAGFFLALNVYIDFQIAAFLALVSALWFLYVGTTALRSAAAAQRLRRAVWQWAVTGLVASILSLPMLGFVLNDFAIEGGDYIRVYPLKYSADRSYDLVSFFIPNARSTLYQNLPSPRVEGVNASVNTPDDSELSPDRQAFLGVVALGLAVVGVWRAGRGLRFWAGVTLLFGLLSLGPVLHILGKSTPIPLPFVLVNDIPILNHIRIPMRYGVIVFFGVALLAGGGAQVVLTGRDWLALPLTALILLEAAVLPYPTLKLQIPRVYEQIAQEPGDATLLEIPSFNWRAAARNEVYQIFHQKRILRAYTNRIAPDLADYFSLRQTPVVVRSLRVLEGAEKGPLAPADLAQDREAAAATAQFFNLRYVLLHRDQLSADRAAQVDVYLRDVLGAQVMSDADNLTAYTVPAPVPASSSIALRLEADTSLMYLGRGWQTEPLADAHGMRGRYFSSGRAEFYFPLDVTGAQELAWTSLQPAVTIDGELNGVPLGRLALPANTWARVALGMPAGLVHPGLNRFTWHYQPDARMTLAVGAVEVTAAQSNASP